jgi:hypothetical protein
VDDDMFENVPERLTEYIRKTPLHIYDSRRELVYLNAASGVIAEYLHKNFFTPSDDQFIGQRKIANTETYWFGYPMRITLIGETLFSMRSSLGFSEFCRRLKGRDLRATFYELWPAKMLLRAGFTILAKAETGIKGQDFDFSAIRELDTINVEVTALTAKTFSVNTILNALNQKRKQLASQHFVRYWTRADIDQWRSPISIYERPTQPAAICPRS